jgi:hypothetical protein
MGGDPVLGGFGVEIEGFRGGTESEPRLLRGMHT